MSNQQLNLSEETLLAMFAVDVGDAKITTSELQQLNIIFKKLGKNADDRLKVKFKKLKSMKGVKL